MHRRAHRLWGKPMSDYFFRDPVHAFVPEGRMPPTNYVKASMIPQLEQTCKPSQDTYYLFSGILSLLSYPSELYNLNGTMLLSRCMLALRHFADDSGPQANKVSKHLVGLTLETLQ